LSGGKCPVTNQVGRDAVAAAVGGPSAAVSDFAVNFGRHCSPFAAATKSVVMHSTLWIHSTLVVGTAAAAAAAAAVLLQVSCLLWRTSLGVV